MDVYSDVGAVLRPALLALGAAVLLAVSVTGVRAAAATSGGSLPVHRLVRWSGAGFRWVGERLGARLGSRAMALSAPVGLVVVLVAWLTAWEAGLLLASIGLGADVPAPVAHTGRTALVVLFGVYVLRTGEAYGMRERQCAERADVRVAEELLAGYLDVGGRERLDRVLAVWAAWLVELRRAHRAWPALLYTRPSERRCWLETVVIMLDVAALAESIAPAWAPPHTTAVLVNGTDCITEALASTGAEPPRSTISLHGREDRAFADTVSLLTEAGLRVERDPADAWAEFQSRRTRYAPAASALAVKLLYVGFEERC
ncbi:hypothetical protein ALI22I_30345 [Saccharothrix sp. ALI-22-I]|uniref:hypothetical protein n=1 Tax=Saccharothrix sp. ALI-22-I TaxID=1933778 RepID=UPI00097C76A6|nr:hypothetical protein [Saccharothrix sp. ALI-22-I]ONI84794.1 hypothetical protein ALI22I_30345 [Saccharothrix sp. ALI-22-I]